MIMAFGEPSPKTVWVAFFQRSQAWQPAAARRRLMSEDLPVAKFVALVLSGADAENFCCSLAEPFIEL
jgi:hypothetical protein